MARGRGKNGGDGQPKKRPILARLLPVVVKRAIANPIRKIARQTSEEPYSRSQHELYFRSRPDENVYCIKPGEVPPSHENADLPVTPKELWLGYGEDVETYLASGKRNVVELIRILGETGFSVTGVKRILEFGCAAGRLIRHFPEVAPNAELWGVDVNAHHIRWCIQNLTPTIHFATTTLLPHLPFEDHFFDLIFCGSIFTHIEDTQESWLLELGRVLRPSGKLYLTIHDENTVRLLDTKYNDSRLAKAMRAQPIYALNKDKFDVIVIGRGPESQVFYNSAYFRFACPPIFRWISLTGEAYGYQSAVVLEKLEL